MASNEKGFSTDAQSLSTARLLIAALFDSAPMPIAIFSVSGVHDIVNANAAACYGMTIEQMLAADQRTLSQFWPHFLRDVRPAIQAVVRTKSTQVITTVFQPPHGTERIHFEVTFFPILNSEGNVKQIGNFSRDLTEQMRVEAELETRRGELHQAEKLASLGSLLAGVAHELNNPLAIVVGRAAILEEKLVGSPLLLPLQKLRAAADRCNRIVKTFLAMARQSGPSRSRVQLNELVEGALEMSAYGLRTDDVEVCLDLYPALPSTFADNDQLVQVLINLIINAQHAMAAAPGEHRLTVRTRHSQRAKAIILEVEDTGPGVPADLVTRIFDPFFTTKDVGAGTGMGLSVSKGMIEAHDGTLTLSRNGARGATFRISLPIIDGTDTSIPAKPLHLLEPARGTVLIVDDEPDIAEILADCLAPLGLVCDFASDGVAALQRISTKRYDAIFTDVRMPGMDGLTLYQRIEENDPALAEKVAFVSGDVLHNDPSRIAIIGDRPVIEKPFDPLQVREIAMTILASGDGK